MHRGDYVRLLRKGPDEETDFRLKERELFGRDHTEAGSALLVTLALPPVLGEVAAGHHELPTKTPTDTVVLMHVACRAATAMGFGARRGDRELPPDPFADLVDVVPYAYREQLRKNAQSLKNVVMTLVDAYKRAFS